MSFIGFANCSKQFIMYLKKILSVCLLLFFSFQSGYALHLDSLNTETNKGEGLRISILTGGVGQEMYSSFGHTGIRIIDSTRGTDEVYNYGVFNFSDPDFYTKFVLGRLLYYIDKSSFSQFMYGFEAEKRTVEEQVLNLPDAKKRAIRQYLETNLLPQNRGYYYSFLYDNCATRVRDIFPDVLGSSFSFGNILKGDKISYRKNLNAYLSQKHWERFGINLLLGSPTDHIMTDSESMFLPDNLFVGLEKATYKNQPIVVSSVYLLNKSVQTSHFLDGPLWLNIGIFILTLLSFQTRAFHYLKGIIRFLLLFTSGLLGCFFLFMWLGTDHAALGYNYNILWAFPLNIIVAFFAYKKGLFLKYYSASAILLLLIALILSFSQVQVIPIIELAPFLLSLIYVYVDLWKKIPQNNAGAVPA